MNGHILTTYNLKLALWISIPLEIPYYIPYNKNLVLQNLLHHTNSLTSKNLNINKIEIYQTINISPKKSTKVKLCFLPTRMVTYQPQLSINIFIECSNLHLIQFLWNDIQEEFDAFVATIELKQVINHSLPTYFLYIVQLIEVNKERWKIEWTQYYIHKKSSLDLGGNIENIRLQRLTCSIGNLCNHNPTLQWLRLPILNVGWSKIFFFWKTIPNIATKP